VTEGAVRVSLICFARSSEQAPEANLDGARVQSINADLSGSAAGETQLDLTTAKSLTENINVAFQGTSKKAKFELEGDVARAMLLVPNVHHKSNADVVRPWANGLQVTRRPSDAWIIDFGITMTESEAALYEQPFQYAVEFVKPARITNNRESYRKYWWRHAEARPNLRVALSSLGRFVATVAHSKFRLFVWLDKSVCPDQALFAFARQDDSLFGCLHSRFHECWSLGLGSWLGVGNDPRYTPTTCFETFPFPEGLTPDLKPEEYNNPHAAEIAAAAKRLNELRENWLNPPEWVDVVPEVVAGFPDRIIPKSEFAKAIKERTLTNLYNARQKGDVQWLEDAHRTLDAVVAKAYGWSDYTPQMPEEEILRRLLALNLSRSKTPL
jgi:type II restriction/modification system DNA methylase subunit YeeA